MMFGVDTDEFYNDGFEAGKRSIEKRIAELENTVIALECDSAVLNNCLEKQAQCIKEMREVINETLDEGMSGTSSLLLRAVLERWPG